MQIKICGITQPEQGRAIAQLGASALGFICVPSSPRYVSPEKIRAIGDALGNLSVERVGVFVDASLETMVTTVAIAGLTTVQLHGQESIQTCQDLRQALPKTKLIKAFRVKTPAVLATTTAYQEVVDALLLDAYHPQQYGGTGQVLDWQALQSFQPSIPWFLAGGLTPDNILEALSQLSPTGIDLSSGVERAPGDKDLAKVTALFHKLASV